MSLHTREAVLNSAMEDLAHCQALSDYEAVNDLWVAFVKIANLMPGKSEHNRMVALATKFPAERSRALLAGPTVETLLNLNPPLETILSSPHERLRTPEVRAAMQQIVQYRETQPQKAIAALGEVVKIIRNKREHGFKTRSGPRDMEILGAARAILSSFCELAVSVV